MGATAIRPPHPNGAITVHDHHPTTPHIDAWLAAQELTKTDPGLEATDSFLDQIAGLAVDSEPAAKLLRTIRYKFEQGEHNGTVRLDAEDPIRNDAAAIVAQRLVNVGYLTTSKVVDGRLNFSLNQLSDAQRDRLVSFLKGTWLERGVREVARRALGSDAEVAGNVTVTDAAGRTYELDLVVALPGGGIVVIECKARNGVARCLPRLRDVCDALGVDGPTAVMVAGGVEPEVVTDALAFHRITVLAPSELDGHLRQLAGESADALVAERIAPAEATVIALPSVTGALRRSS